MVAMIKEGDRFSKRTLGHVMQQANQVTSEVTAILDHGFRQINLEKPNINTAIIRSDNAVRTINFKCTYLYLCRVCGPNLDKFFY